MSQANTCSNLYSSPYSNSMFQDNEKNGRVVVYNSHQQQYSLKRQTAIRKRKQERLNRILILCGAAIVLVFCLFFCIIQFSKGNVATAHASDSNMVSYISIEVANGDNLWTISKENKTSTMSTKQYMNEVIQLNQLGSDELQSGKYLLIPIYH